MGSDSSLAEFARMAFCPATLARWAIFNEPRAAIASKARPPGSRLIKSALFQVSFPRYSAGPLFGFSMNIFLLVGMGASQPLRGCQI